MSGGPALTYCTTDDEDDKIAAELAHLRRERDVLHGRLDWLTRTLRHELREADGDARTVWHGEFLEWLLDHAERRAR